MLPVDVDPSKIVRVLIFYVHIKAIAKTCRSSSWRNRLARPTVNREVDSSILSEDGVLFAFCRFQMHWE